MARGKNREVALGGTKAGGAESTLRRKIKHKFEADYGVIDGNLIRAAIEALVIRGGAIRFGATSDGGAFAVGVYDGDDRWTEYCRSDDELREYLEQIAASGDNTLA